MEYQKRNQETKQPSSTRWMWALLMLLLAIAIWFLPIFNMNQAAAGGSRISLSVRSDNGRVLQGQSLASLSFSILSDLASDWGLLPNGNEGDSVALRQSTATAQATASPQPLGDLASPTATATGTPSPSAVPTATTTAQPTLTKTPAPTVVAATSTSACLDCKKPSIKGATVSPSDGDLGSCTTVISVSDLHVVDPDFSSGMQWVGVKYKFEISGGVYNFVKLDKTEGPGWTTPGTTWDAKYGGSVPIDFSKRYGYWDEGGGLLAKRVPKRRLLAASTVTPTATATGEPSATPTASDTPEPTDTPTSKPPTATPTASTYTVKLWAKAEDKAGNVSYLELATYTCTE